MRKTFISYYVGFVKKNTFFEIKESSTLLLGNPYTVKQIHSREKQQKYQRRKSLHRLFDLDFSSIFSRRLSRISCPFGSKKKEKKFEYHNRNGEIWKKNFILLENLKRIFDWLLYITKIDCHFIWFLRRRKTKSIRLVQVARMRWLLLCWLIHWWHFSYEERNSAILCGILTALFLNHRRIDSSIPVEKMESFQFSG